MSAAVHAASRLRHTASRHYLLRSGSRKPSQGMRRAHAHASLAPALAGLDPVVSARACTIFSACMYERNTSLQILVVWLYRSGRGKDVQHPAARLTMNEARQLHSDWKARLLESETEHTYTTCSPSVLVSILAACANESDARKRQAKLCRAIQACEGQARKVKLNTASNRELFYTEKARRSVCSSKQLLLPPTPNSCRSLEFARVYVVQGEDERDRCLRIKCAFLKLVLPIWLREMVEHNAPAAAAIPLAMRPQKRIKTAKQLREERIMRAEVLTNLTDHFFIPLEVQQGPSRRGKAPRIISFTSYS